MNPQFEDERSQAVRQITPRLVSFTRVSAMVLLAQVAVIVCLLVGLYFKEVEAFGVTQSGEVFKLQVYRK